MNDTHMTSTWPILKQIPAGTGVAIVAPSGAALDEAGLVRGIALLEAQGCRVYNYYDHAHRHQRFAASDVQRVAQLHAAIANPEVQVVMALRGAYGLSRILSDIDYDAIAASGKLLVGFSDFTALQLALLARTGAASFAGPMLCGDFGALEPNRGTISQFWQCVTQPEYTVTVPLNQPLNQPRDRLQPLLDVHGTLWGGNLALIAHLVGTPYLPQIDGGILFLEDIGEHPYRIERMLLQLHYAGVLKNQRAVLLGDFSGYRLAAHDNGYDFDAMLAYLRVKLGLPVLSGLPFGHRPDRVTLALGAQAHLYSHAEGWRLSLSDYPILLSDGTLHVGRH